MNATFLIVSNEIGMGIHAATEVGRKFVELQGWANQYVAALSEEVIFMISGIPLQVKSALKNR
jgi:adenosylcobinamide kinase/adenosylcobinamide-phosphate guanylyltransferase